MSRGSRTVPPSISGTPHRRQKTPNVASSAATRRSHQSASSRPPATAYPSTAAITGLLRRRRVGPIGPSPSGSTRLSIAFRSAPAQKVPPAPVSTATLWAAVGLERAERRGERVGRGAVDGVAGLGPVEDDRRHRPVDLGVHAHRVSVGAAGHRPRCRTRTTTPVTIRPTATTTKGHGLHSSPQLWLVAVRVHTSPGPPRLSHAT